MATTTSSTSSTRRRRSLTQTASLAFYWLAILGAILACLWNLQPYLRLSQWGLLTVFGVDTTAIPEGPVDAVATTAIANLLRLAGWGMGFVLWALLQACETYPIILQHDRATLRQAVIEAESSPPMAIRDGDDPALIQVKRWYNGLPLKGVRVAMRAALIAYAVDGTICLVTYPPVDGGLDRLLFILITGQTGLINWPNVLLILCMMFGFQILFRGILWLGRQAYLHRRAYASTAK